jgi:MFS family permease
VSACFYIIGFTLVLVLYRDDRSSGGQRTDDDAERVTFGSVIAFEHFVLLMGVIFGVQVVDRSLGPILPLYLGTLGVPPERVALVAGLLFSTIAVTAAIGHHACGPLLRRRPARQVIATGALVAGLAVAVFLLFSPTAPLVVLAVFFGFAVGVTMTASYATAGGVLPASGRATGFGFLTSASLAAMALSPMTSGALAARSLVLVFVVDALLMAIVATVVWRTMAPGARSRSVAADTQAVAPVVDEE